MGPRWSFTHKDSRRIGEDFRKKTHVHYTLLIGFIGFRLSKNLQMKFLLHVRKFMSEKKFEGRSDLIITEEIKALVSAAAVQLTFGLNKYTHLMNCRVKSKRRNRFI